MYIPSISKYNFFNLRASVTYRKILFHSVSVLALALGSAVSPVQPSRAAPSITYTGNVTPAPPAGATDWDWSPVQVMVVGDAGAATLDIRDGATISGDTIYIGRNNGAGQPAVINVDGKGSTITTTHINLGQGGYGDDGTLTISNGGRVDSNSNDAASILVGLVGGATGHIIVTGQGSSLNSDNVITLGFLGTGDLTIADGGQVTGYQLYLGNTQTGVGTATISGHGSAWNGQHGVWVGQIGTGTLNLSEGGSINDNSLQIAYDVGTNGTVNVGGAMGDPAKTSGNLNVNAIAFNRNGGGSRGVLNFNTTDGTTVRAAISGIGTINQIAGTTVFTGDNSAFAGTMNITGGTLQLGNGGTSGNLAVDVSTGTDATHRGTLAFNRSDNVSFDHIISGTGSIKQMGAGTTILTKDNTYSGGTTISGGTLSVASDAKLGDAAGGLTLDGGTLQVTGTQFTSTARAMTLGDHGGGFDIDDAGNMFTVAQALSGQGRLWKRGNGTLVLSGDNLFTGGLTVEKGTAKAGIAEHAFGSGLLTVEKDGTVDLDSFNEAVAGLAGSGHVALGSGWLTLDQDGDTSFSGTMDGTGGLTKNGSGKLTLSGTSTYSGQTQVNDGALIQAAAGSFSSASAYAVAQEGQIDLGGYTTGMASLSNSGTINFGGAGGAVLDVAGNYAGNGGTLVLNTVLGDDSSKTDLLKVGGDTSGTTNLQVVNRGGLGAQTVNGIEVVSVGGQSNGTFSLVSDYITKDGQKAVVGGAYAYTLQQSSGSGNKDGNWYLTSHMSAPDPDPDCHEDNSCPAPEPRYSAGVPVYEGYVQNMQALNKLPTLQQRVGNRYWNGAANPVIEQGADMAGKPLVPAAEAGAVVDGRAVWGRIEGAHNRFEANRSTSGMKQDINSFILQAGVDGQFYEGETGRLIGGITGQYGKARGDVASDHGDGKIDTQGWGLGGTLTWYGDTGFYADLQAQAMWYDSDLTSATAGRSLINGNKGFGYGFSAEAGRRIDLDNYWSLTPQAQLTWSSVTFDTFNDAWGASVSGRNGDSLNARLGLSADYRNAWRDMHGQIRRSNVYVIANLYQELTGGSSGRVRVAGVDFETEADRTWGGLGAGGTLTWADDKYALYGEGSVNTSLSNFADSYTLKGTVGFKVKW